MIDEYNEWLNEKKLSDDEIKVMWNKMGWDVTIKHGKSGQPKGWIEIWPTDKDKKRFMKELGVSHASMINEGDDFGMSDAKVLKRMYYKKIMNSDKKGLDKMFKEFEKMQDQRKKKQRFGFNDRDIDLLKGWFGERMKQLGLSESYSFESLNEEKYRVEIKGVTHGWMSLDDAKFDPKGKRYSKKEAEKAIQKAVKAGRNPNSIRMVKESLNEAPIAAKGWDSSSVEKFGKTIGKDPKDKGFFDACVLRMKGKEGFDEKKAKGFCASIKDKAYGDPHWRGKGKTKAQAKKDTSGKEYEKK